MEPDLGTLVRAALDRDAAANGASGRETLGVREEDFERMAAAFGMSEERLHALLSDSTE